MKEGGGGVNSPLSSLVSSSSMSNPVGIDSNQFRSSIFQKQPPEAFYKKAVLKNFTIFTEKHLRWSLFLIKLQTFRPETLLKRESSTDDFLWILRNF